MRGLLDMGVALGKEVSVVVQGVIPADFLLAGLDVTMITQPMAQSPGETMADMELRVLR